MKTDIQTTITVNSKVEQIYFWVPFTLTTIAAGLAWAAFILLYYNPDNRDAEKYLIGFYAGIFLVLLLLMCFPAAWKVYGIKLALLVVGLYGAAVALAWVTYNQVIKQNLELEKVKDLTLSTSLVVTIVWLFIAMFIIWWQRNRPVEVEENISNQPRSNIWTQV